MTRFIQVNLVYQRNDIYFNNLYMEASEHKWVNPDDI